VRGAAIMMAPECNVETIDDQRSGTLPSPRKRRANISTETVAVEIITAAGRGYDNDRLEEGHGQHYGNVLQAHPKSLHGPGRCPKTDAA
jgi:hypothetical protein